MRNLVPWSVAILLFLPHAALAQACVSGTSTVEPAEAGSPFDDYWRYTIEVTWSSPQSLSHLSLFFGLTGMECACDEGIFAFDTPAGTTVGVEDDAECTLDYFGEYICTGDPSLPGALDNVAAVKFDPTFEACNAGSTGSGTFVFYSQLAPTDETIFPDLLVVKDGLQTCVGNIVGRLPATDCALPVERPSFGTLKTRF